MRRKIWTVIIVTAILIFISVAEQSLVNGLAEEAMMRTHEIIQMLQNGQMEQGLAQVREMDAWWDEEAPKIEILINHEATDDVRFTLSRLTAALEMGDRDDAFVYSRELEGNIEHMMEREELSLQNLL